MHLTNPMRRAYAVVAYQTAWLKYYYPVEFMAALMTSVIDNSAKVSEYILVPAGRWELQILPPDINESVGVVFRIRRKPSGMDLTAIKSVGQNR